MAGAVTAAEPRVRADKFLTFVVGGETYGVDILAVQEIIRMMQVTAVPKTPAFVRGVINLRGEIIAVIDLRARFDLERCDDTDRSCIVVLQVDGPDGQPVTRGVIVDRVADVLDIPADRIEEPPDMGVRVDVSFIRSIGKTEQRVVMVLDVPRIVSTDLELPELDDSETPNGDE